MHRRPLLSILGTGGLAVVGACSAMPPVPSAQSIAGATPDGTVVLEEDFVAGAGAGEGTLTFRGRSRRFAIVGAVLGPGGLARLEARGDVFNLRRIEDFAGVWSQGTGAAGLDTSREGELWLQNSAGAVMRLKAQRTGGMLSLGRDEILIRFI